MPNFDETNHKFKTYGEEIGRWMDRVNNMLLNINRFFPNAILA